jgi:hypothetical protein
MEFHMTPRVRRFLVLIGLLLVIASLAALIYAFAPVNTLSLQTPIAPTLFTLPAGGVP